MLALSIKDIDIENLEKILMVKNSEINNLIYEVADKNATIHKYWDLKARLHKELDWFKNQPIGTQYLIEARHFLGINSDKYLKNVGIDQNHWG